jgi:VWFA-related protein
MSKLTAKPIFFNSLSAFTPALSSHETGRSETRGVFSSMRKPILLALAALVAVPAGAARRVTVGQLAETLASATAQHRSDDEIARQVGTLELSERLTATTLDQFAAKLSLQPRTALALQLLADQSAFLAPPAAELPATAPPDDAMQQQMMAAARSYAVETWGRLPNFFVSRVTTRFDNSAQVQHAGEFAVRMGLHPVGTSARTITFRDGKEVLDQAPVAAQSGAAAPAKLADELGLSSWGEFGPALTVVLADLAGHKVAFSHWEQIGGELAAVYHYEVPREASHYAVSYSFLDTNTIGRTQFGYSGRARSAQQVANIPRAREVKTYHETPGYHGMIAIDPATGAVVRITIEASLGNGDPLLSAATMIEYAPVTIGDRKFIFPVRSLAISLEPGQGSGCGSGGMALNGVGDTSEWQSPTRRCDHSPILLINETRFADYHRLGSTARILTGDALAEAPNQEPASLPSHAATPAPAVQAPASPETQTQAVYAASPATPSPEPAPTPAPPSQPVIPEISMTAANGVPDNPANAPETPDGFSLKVTARLVDVGLVAYDKQGHAVTDLKAEDLELYDNGRKQEIRFFAPATNPAPIPVPASSASASPSPAAAPDHTFSNRAAGPVSGETPSSSPQTGATILLIDESHVAWNDMNYARGQMLKFLGTLAPSERVGLYSMTGLGFRVLVEATSDHAALTARLKAFMPNAQSVSNAQDEEARNRQQFNEVHNTADLNSVNGNHTDVADAEQPVDPQLLTIGSDPARASLIILCQVARHLSSIPGHKNLVWVSSDNVFADWQNQQVGIDKHPNDSRGYAVRAQEAMNDAHTAVYPFDVSQLEGGAITADIQHRNVELTQAAADNDATAASAGGPSQTTGGRNMQPGRITAEMSQDVHPIQGTVREVAAATGGRTIRRSGDLAAALNGIVDDGHATCQLSFSPQGPADDQYHTITVKLTGRRGLTLRYRTGYLFAKEPVTLKDRFQAAVWKPVDTTEIAVTADVAPISSGASVKLNIAAADLGMQQQAGRWMDKLDIFFIQRDDAGLHAHLEGQTLGLRLKSSTYQNVLPKGVPFERAVQLQPGMASLRVLVVDENSGRMGSVTIPSQAMKANP